MPSFLTKEDREFAEQMEAKFRKEFIDGKFAELMTLEDYIASRRIDEGLALLQPACLAATEAKQSTIWMASQLDADPIAPINAADFLN